MTERLRTHALLLGTLELSAMKKLSSLFLFLNIYIYIFLSEIFLLN